MKRFALLLLLCLWLGSPALGQAQGQGATEASPLAERIERIFGAVPAFEGLSVNVTEGVVRLSGSVPSSVRDEAIELVERLDGTLYVVDDTEQETGVNENLSPALLRLRDYWLSALALLPLLGVALVTVVIFWLLARFLGNWRALYARLQVNPLLRGLIAQFVRVAVILVGFLIALDILGATSFVAAILGTAGVAGLAIGFAFRDIVENYLAGVLMSLRQPFAQNDLVTIGEREGVVVRLTARELVLMTLDGNHVRVPNASVFKSDIVNYTRNPRRRFDFLVGVDVNEDLVQVQALGNSTLKGVRGVMSQPPPFALVQELGDFNVLVRFHGWVDQREADFLKVRSQAVRQLKEAFDGAGVLMPEPITNVRLQEIPATMPLGDEPPVAKLDTVPEVAAEPGDVLDVSVERSLETQLEEEAAMSDEENLLGDAPSAVHQLQKEG